MTGELIPVGDNMLVWVYELEAQGGRIRIADSWLEDPQAHEHYYERRRIEGRLYGRVGTRRRGDSDDERRLVEQGEHALATQTLRQAGLEPTRVAGGRGWL